MTSLKFPDLLCRMKKFVYFLLLLNSLCVLTGHHHPHSGAHKYRGDRGRLSPQSPGHLPALGRQRLAIHPHISPSFNCSLYRHIMHCCWSRPFLNGSGSDFSLSYRFGSGSLGLFGTWFWCSRRIFAPYEQRLAELLWKVTSPSYSAGLVFIQ